MIKSHVGELVRVYEALFKDVTYAYPTLENGLKMDLTLLLHFVEHRGLPVFLVDLPAVGKHLLRCLSGGKYELSGLPLTKGFSNSVVIPKFLRGLYLLVFHEDGSLKDEVDHLAIYFLRQIFNAAKKAVVECHPRKVQDAVVEFLEVDSALPEPDGFWALDKPNPSHVKETFVGFERSLYYRGKVDSMDSRKRIQLSLFLTTLDTVSGIVSAALGSYDPSAWRFRHGKGAVSEVTGPHDKYVFANWSDRLEHVYPIADYGFHSYSSWAGNGGRSRCVGSQEPSSRMVAVPKSYDGPRLIAAEPSEHQWCQQNLLDYFAQRCRSTWIDRFCRFDDQSLNQSLCKANSSGGHLATVDLSSASDHVTCHLVGQLFRSNPNLLIALQATRTRYVSQKLTRKVPALIELRKFSTMGSACTFPVETLVFLSIALACVLTTRKLKPCERNILRIAGEIAVYGDDIIIPVDCRDLFVEALEVLDFKINSSKTFWTGKFRESCGVDSYDGVDVTPVYWRTFYDGSPESLASVVMTSNRFYKKFLLNTAAHLASTLPRFVCEVSMDSGTFGLTTRCEPHLSANPMRWNANLQRFEVLICLAKATQVSTQIEGDSALFQFFTESPDPTNEWSSGVRQRPTSKIRRQWESIWSVAPKLHFT
jgi:hypothetical protein